MSNYRPVSLLPICSKLFEKIIFDTILQHLMANKLLNPNQSGFMPGDSCIHQLISIIHEIYASFDAISKDISKAFGRVWYEGLIYKIKYMGVKGNLIALIGSLLFERQQRVVLNGQESEWLTIKASVPHLRVQFLVHCFFYIY